MKKVILFFVWSVFAVYSYAQNAGPGHSYESGSDKVLNLSADQIAKIKKLNMEVGPKFREIGRSNLPGYEKGRRKRALALEHKAAIRAILTQGQADVWEYRYGSIEGGRSMSDTVKDQYEKQIEQLEKRYEREKEAIEDGHLPKYEKKSVLDKLKRNYKAEKERLKEQRDAVLESVMYE